VKAFVWWKWQFDGTMGRNVGTLSRQHRANPDDPHVTWCGALAIQGPKYGIAQVFHSDTVSEDIEPCEDCARLNKPMKVQRGIAVEVAA
jgi:hypothetical protein